MKEMILNAPFLICLTICFVSFVIGFAFVGYQIFRPYHCNFKVSEGRPKSFRLLIAQFSIIFIVAITLFFIFIFSTKGIVESNTVSTLITLLISVSIGAVATLGLKKEQN